MNEKTTSGNAIIDGIATILWGSSWADAYETAGGSLSGMKIEDVMPPVPLEAFVDAGRLAGMIEQANGCGLWTLLHRAAEADAAGNEARKGQLFEDADYAARFGECLAWAGTGNGISWFDDHADFPLEIPLFEPLGTIDAATEAAKDDQEAPRP